MMIFMRLISKKLIFDQLGLQKFIFLDRAHALRFHFPMDIFFAYSVVMAT